MDIRVRLLSLRSAARSDDGQTMAEYGVLLAFVTLAVVITLTVLAVALADNLSAVANVLARGLPGG